MSRRRLKRHPPGEQFLMIPFDLLQGRPPNHQAILVDLARRHNGGNNGTIGYGCREAAQAAHVSPNTAGRILDELQKDGVIRITREAAFNMKTGSATREWEIQFLKKGARSRGRGSSRSNTGCSTRPRTGGSPATPKPSFSK
jgi:hypothetical protein